MSSGPLSRSQLAAARTLARERVVAEVLGALHGAGVPCVLLKGPAIARWLYAPGERASTDTDVLVPLARRSGAERVLNGLGFAARLRPEDVTPGRALHAHPWKRDADGAVVDLHVTLDGIGVEPDEAFDLLWGVVEPMRVGGLEVAVLQPAGRAFHIALHAASDGNREKPLRDLQRALDQVDGWIWREALVLAGEVEATEAFAAGLRRLPDGAALADRLELSSDRSVATALKASDAPHEALTVAHLAETRGAAAKAKIVVNRIAPSPSYMRFRSSLARRGRGGLAAAYVLRPFSHVARAPRAVRAWRQAVRRG